MGGRSKHLLDRDLYLFWPGFWTFANQSEWLFFGYLIVFFRNEASLTDFFYLFSCSSACSTGVCVYVYVCMCVCVCVCVCVCPLVSSHLCLSSFISYIIGLGRR